MSELEREVRAFLARHGDYYHGGLVNDVEMAELTALRAALDATAKVVAPVWDHNCAIHQGEPCARHFPGADAVIRDAPGIDPGTITRACIRCGVEPIDYDRLYCVECKASHPASAPWGETQEGGVK